MARLAGASSETGFDRIINIHEEGIRQDFIREATVAMHTIVSSDTHTTSCTFKLESDASRAQNSCPARPPPARTPLGYAGLGCQTPPPKPEGVSSMSQK